MVKVKHFVLTFSTGDHQLAVSAAIIAIEDPQGTHLT